MKYFDIKSHHPPVSEAMKDLDSIIKQNRNKEVVIKIIHGYGSTGDGGKIRVATLANLKRKKATGNIVDFIPGNAFQNSLGYVDVIQKYRKYLKGDRDYNQDNDGITFVILKKIS